MTQEDGKHAVAVGDLIETFTVDSGGYTDRDVEKERSGGAQDA